MLPGFGRFYLWYELSLSLLIAALTWLVIEKTIGQPALDKFLGSNRQILYSSIAVIAGSLLGFILAGVAILIALPENRLLRIVQGTEAYSQVNTIFLSTLRFLAFTTLLALIALFVDTVDHPHILLFYLPFWGLLISAFRMMRCVWVLENLMAITQKGRQEDG